MKLLSKNIKIEKNELSGKYFSTGLSLAPYDKAIKGKSVCPYSTPTCREFCIDTSGFGGFKNAKKAKIKRTEFFLKNRAEFMRVLFIELSIFKLESEMKGLIPVVRLNTFSDISWEKLPAKDGKSIIDLFPEIRFYDYTKNPFRRNLAQNYSLTFSWVKGRTKDEEIKEMLENGINVSVIFYPFVPAEYKGMKVINGDVNDLRFTDPKGVIIGLKAKFPMGTKKEDKEIQAKKFAICIEH